MSDQNEPRLPPYAIRVLRREAKGLRDEAPDGVGDDVSRLRRGMLECADEIDAWLAVHAPLDQGGGEP